MSRIRILFSYIMPYKWHAVQNIGYNILSAVFALFSYSLIAPFLRILFDGVRTSVRPGNFEPSLDWLGNYSNYLITIYVERVGEIGALVGVCVLVIIASFFKNLFVFLSNNAMAFLRAGTTRDMRNKLYRKVLKLPVTYFSDARKGDILTRMSNDVQEVQVSVMGSLTMLFRDPITLIIFITYLFMSSFQLTLFALILLPVSGWLIGRIGKSLRFSSFRSQQYLGQLLSVVEETLSGLRIIKAFNAEKKMDGSFVRENERFTKLFRRVIRKRYLASPVSEFLSTIVLMIVLYFGGSLVLTGSGEMTSDRLIAYIIIFSQIIPPAKNITTAYFHIQKGFASLDRLNEVLDADERIIEKDDAVAINDFNSEIEFKNVSFAYDKDIVLKNINLVVRKGETVAIVGKSGSGKSTLVDLLPRFMDADSGRITIDGVDLKDIKLKNLRSLIGFVNQQAILFNDTFRNNIAFSSNEPGTADVVQAAMVANAHEFIIESPEAYEYYVGEGGSRLSGGQRQRISIARAVMANPPILILDEATSALDTESERLVQDAIEKLMKNRTSIVIAHRLSTVQRADRIVVIDEGRIVEEGSHEELMNIKGGVYRKLHKLQMM
ncbi:MAG: ABC transporter ATP-binding protein/permease [Bacteroidales bacterium]|nr:ABC transporter ATP-binding protein/permease [Bacteroidales bacterium]